MEKNKYLVKNLGILTISNFASKILVFLLVPLYTSVLTTSEYGVYDLVVSTVSLLYPILSLNIVDAVMRFSMDESSSKEDIASIGIKYILISIAIIGTGLLFLNWFNFFPSLKGLKIYIFLYYCLYVLNQFFIQFAKGLERVKDMGVAAVLATVVMLGGNILFLMVFKTGLQGFFWANILSLFVSVLYFICRLKFLVFIKHFNTNTLLEKQMVIYCVPLIFTVLGWWINSTADKYTVTFLCGVAANGLLSVSYKIPSILNTLQGIFIQAWQISAIKEYGEKGNKEFYGNTFMYINVIMCAACSWLILLTKPIAFLMYAKDFYLAWQYVPFLLVSSVINCASGFVGPILSAKKDSKSMARSAIYGAIANVAMNIMLVRAVGVQGAPLATMISSYVIYYFRRKAAGNDLVIKKYWKVIVTWCLLCVQAIIKIYMSIWIIEIIIMLVMLIMNVDTLMSALNIFDNRKLKGE